MRYLGKDDEINIETQKPEFCDWKWVDLKKITELSHKKNAIVIGDGVSYAPHGFPDVKELGVDFYTFSLYKTYGPHLALLYGKVKKIIKVILRLNG